MNILIFLIILLVLVVSHEFGHFIVAKLNKIRVDEFSFGFPPKLFGKKVGETTYNFNLLPLGGYVKIFGQGSDDFPGQNGQEAITDSDKERSFVNKPRYVQAMVLLAGVAMNFLVAWLLLSIGFMSGLPSSAEVAPRGAIVEDQALTIVSVSPNSPAEKAGLEIGDKILALETSSDTTKIISSNFTAETVQNFVKKNGSEEINFSITRGKEDLGIKVTPEISESSGSSFVGISMDMIGKLKLPIHKAIWEGLKLSGDLTVKIAVGFYTLIRDGVIGKGDLSSVTGPVGIVGVVGDAASFGFIYLLSFTALISINLVIINLIPFPALDGGRLLFLLIEKIKGSRINPKVSNMVNMIGFGILMLFMVIITYHDIVKLF